MKLLAPVVAFGLALVGCGSSPSGETDIRDVRVAIPDPDPAYVDFVTNEEIIQPGEDKMFCNDMIYEGEDIAYNDMIFMQGKYGHHIIPLAGKNASRVGTHYDCTQMTGFEPLSIPIGKSYPDTYGAKLTKGTVVVAQMHYVNTGSVPIRTRDVIRLKKMPMSSVKTWASAFIANDYLVDLPPNSTGITKTYDCTIPQDVEVMELGGHMHEWGQTFKFEHGPDLDHLTTLYSVDQWKPEYRDAPPVNLYLSAPLKLAKNSILRTTCTWNNDTDKTIHFPSEMCTGFALITGTEKPIVCAKNEKTE
ncbi:MAG: hypothetical protein K1X64_16220 [Myxococcaceae bacterium]|nr:hypothetical protein [Myxococcaceae bacterium]